MAIRYTHFKNIRDKIVDEMSRRKLTTDIKEVNKDKVDAKDYKTMVDTLEDNFIVDAATDVSKAIDKHILVNNTKKLLKTPIENFPSTCKNLCTGLCTDKCNNSCLSDCGGVCSSGCGGCSTQCNGCTGCGGSCKFDCNDMCQSCTGTCSTNCTGECVGSCNSYCTMTCSGNCIGVSK